jgi:OOP family OmpA-OmpF porin
MIIKQTLTSTSPIAAVVAALVSITGCSNSPAPANSNYRSQGYLQDTAGNNAVVKSLGYDACVRTGDWTPARATIECDPDLAPKPLAKAPVVSPAPPAAPPALPPASPAPLAPQATVVTPPPAPSPAPAPQRFTLSADAMFDFNRSVLRPGGRKKLDDLADTLRGTQHDAIVATGHTDRVGSVRYNQRLSELRAAAVKRYLMGKGLDVGKISAVGKGKSQPVTKPDDCPRGKMSNAVLFACLQPDRRVEIEVSGSKVIDPNAPVVAKPTAPDARQAKAGRTKSLIKSKAKPSPKIKTLIGY